MDYSNILQFKGKWRNYQARVLEHAPKYMEDGRVHIVAAPGSGKTTLGIELIARLNETALVLAPSITIREQWVARIATGFLKEGLIPEDYISQNLKDPRCITVVTYQSLHCAMSHYKGVIDEAGTTVNSLESDDQIAKKQGAADAEVVDYTGFDVISEMKAAGIGVLCLDECHHLRSEWWKALEEFRKSLGKEVKLIALTATPPYDSTPVMWKRYMDMCGPIDEEITVPELVKEGSLCPHQDYVYFNYPTEEELAEVQKFKERSNAVQGSLWGDQDFLQALLTHGALNGSLPESALSERAEYLTALLSFLSAKNQPIPEHLRRLVAKNGIPSMTIGVMETLLQGFVYDDADSYGDVENFRTELENELKRNGLIEKKKVCLVASEAIEKLLISSKGKCLSIQRIVESEYVSMGSKLRMLVLTDYIRKEYEKAVGNEEADVFALGVLPFFEQLRRAYASTGLRIGVLCGTIVIIPAEAKDALLTTIGAERRVTFSTVGRLAETDYVKVTAVGDSHFLTQAVTDIFTQGCMQVLIGTKSLLGEGWDSPCINSLILASFVGSYMLSNQMRGRAIRVFSKAPDKTSNIWHLVCLMPEGLLGQLHYAEPAGGTTEESMGQDFALLERRMENFLGLHYEQNVIENGMARFSIIKAPYSKEHVEEINRRMLALAKERATLKERWATALDRGAKMEVIDTTSVEEDCITKTQTQSSKVKLALAGAGVMAGLGLAMTPLGWIGGLAAVASGAYGAVGLAKASRVKNPAAVMKSVGEGIYIVLGRKGLLEEKGASVKVEEGKKGRQAVFLEGGSGRDKLLFAQCVNEFFSAVNDQRYLLVKKGRHDGEDGFYCVPECFARKKEDAQSFYDSIRPYIGTYELVYTRNERGREFLLEGRLKSLTDAKERSVSRKTWQ